MSNEIIKQKNGVSSMSNEIIKQIELWIKADIISFDDLEGLAASAYAYEAAKDAEDGDL